jgi:DNA-binding LytR/AlgR family response regulator
MTRRPTALIADDEPLLRKSLARLLGLAWPELDILAFARNGREAVEKFNTLQPDICFLDVHMPGISGVEAAQQIGRRANLVFVTAYDSYAVQAFQHGALDYLMKPVEPERLADTVARLQERLRAAQPRPDTEALLEELAVHLRRKLGLSAAAAPVAAAASVASAAPASASTASAVPASASTASAASAPAAAPASAGASAAPVATATATATNSTAAPRPGDTPLRWIRASVGATLRLIPVDAIDYLRSDEKYTRVAWHDDDGKPADALVRTALKELLAQLDPQQFAQVHRSVVVNLHAISHITRGDNETADVHLKHRREVLPVSRSYVHLFRQM